MSEPDSKKPPRASSDLPMAVPNERAQLRAEREARRARRVQLAEAAATRRAERIAEGDARGRVDGAKPGRTGETNGSSGAQRLVERDEPRRGGTARADAIGSKRRERPDSRRFASDGPRRGRERRREEGERPRPGALDDQEDPVSSARARAPSTPDDPTKTPEKVPLPTPAPARAPTKGAAELRQSRARKLLWRALLCVLLPTVASVFYYYRQASPQYESVSLLTIYSSETIPTTTSGFDALIGLGSGSSIVTDGLSVREYVFSRDILRRLNDEERFIEHYKDRSKDWYSRMPKDASFEEAYQDYDDWVRVEVDPASGVATLSVRAYSAEAAERFSKAIIHYAEEMVNDLSRRARSDQVRFAEDTVKQAEDRLTKARQELVKVQTERGEYNPELSAQAQLSIRTALESQVATARAELAQLQAYLTPDAPQVIGAKEKVRSLAAQVAGASRKMVSATEDGQSLNKSAAEFEAAVVEKEFATASYQAAMSALSVARASAARQHRYLATIAPPSFADESVLPVRWLGVLTVFLCSLLLMGVGSLLIAGVKEHARL